MWFWRNKKMSKIVVVGANHAGTAAINTMLDNYSGNEVVVLERNFNTSFLGCGMALWIGDQIQGGGEGLFYSSPEQLREKGAKVSINTEVEKYGAYGVYGSYGAYGKK